MEEINFRGAKEKNGKIYFQVVGHEYRKDTIKSFFYINIGDYTKEIKEFNGSKIIDSFSSELMPLVDFLKKEIGAQFVLPKKLILLDRLLLGAKAPKPFLSCSKKMYLNYGLYESELQDGSLLPYFKEYTKDKFINIYIIQKPTKEELEEIKFLSSMIFC